MTLPSRFGKFEIVAELGSGAMGCVYRARDPALDRSVALKTISPALLSSRDAIARFQREARAAARLSHPNIVTVYEIGEAEGTRYIAMELIEGCDLAEAMTPADRYPLEKKVRMMVEVCRGLDYAHSMGVVHRDVKPANIRVTREGTVKILDFGIARLGESDMTQTGTVLGTPSYVSPELLLGARVDHHADMWAVGVILYEMVGGRRPFDAPTVTALVHSIVHDAPLPLDARALGVPDALVATVQKALDKDATRRYQDLGAMANALLAAIGAAPVAEPPLDPVVRKRAYDANLGEARRLLAEGELSAALDAARRALRLEPGQAAVAALVRSIEARLGSRPAASAGRPRSDATAVAPLRPQTPATATAASASPAAATPLPGPGPIDSAVLRARLGAAFRDEGTFGEPPATREAALSPAADLLVLAGADGGLRAWDLHARTRRLLLRTELHQRTGHDAAALSLAFSPDGSLLASGHVDGLVHLWDVASGAELQVRLRHDDSVGALAFSPDGATLATGSLDATLRLWDVGAALAGEARRELFRQPAAVTAALWACGGEWIVTGHASRVLRLFDPQRGRLVATLRGPDALVDLLALSPDGCRLLAGSHDRLVRVFDLDSRELVTTLGPFRRPVASMCFLAEGAFLATVCLDNSVQIWDLASGDSPAALWGPAGETFTTVGEFGDGSQLAVALADGRVRTWSAVR